jgi:hypothetical protein
VDDLTGRRLGSQCGQGVWALARKYFDGSITNTPVNLAIRHLNDTQCEIRYNTLRGFYYKLQSTPDLSQPFTDTFGGFRVGTNSSVARADGVSTATKFYRVVSALSP